MTTFAVRLFVAALLCITGSVLAQTQVTLWYSVGGDALDELIARYNNEHPDVEIIAVDVGNYNEAITRLQAAVVSGRVPDMVQLEITRYGLFSERGVLLPLTEFIESTPAFDIDDLIPGIWEAAQYKGVPYVIPFNNSVPVMYFNTELFRQAGLDPENPPATWDELLAAVRTLTIRDDSGNTVQWGLSGPPQWVRHAFVRQNGGDWMNEALTDLTLNEPEAIEAYTWLYNLIAEEQVAYPEASIDANEGTLARQDFVSGRTAIMFTSTGSLGGLLRDIDFELGVAALPCRHTCAAPIGGATVGILANAPSEQQHAAWDFIVWLTNTENNAFWHVETGYMPIRRSTLETQTAEAFYAENPAFQVAIDQFQAASFPRPRPPAMPAIRQLELTTWEEIVTGSKTVEQALNDLARESNILLANE
jgi:sn-glycerol 3-phosphate transport system substrate-binding protein